MMDFGDHLRTTGGALKNWAIAQLLDSLAVGALWLIGLYLLHVPLAPMWAVIAAVLQIVPHFGPVLGVLWPFWGVFVAAPLLAVFYAYRARRDKIQRSEFRQE